LKEDEAHRLKALEQENARLKRIVAEQAPPATLHGHDDDSANA
jgi:hypothetical protein